MPVKLGSPCNSAEDRGLPILAKDPIQRARHLQCSYIKRRGDISIIDSWNIGLPYSKIQYEQSYKRDSGELSISAVIILYFNYMIRISGILEPSIVEVFTLFTIRLTVGLTLETIAIIGIRGGALFFLCRLRLTFDFLVRVVVRLFCRI